jgi:hypothetical protein
LNGLSGGLSTEPQPLKPYSSDDWALLSSYLEQHPAGTLDPETIMVLPQFTNADEGVSSPESSSAASSSNDRQDSAPVEVPVQASNKRKTSNDAPQSSLKDSRRGAAKNTASVQHTHEAQDG